MAIAKTKTDLIGTDAAKQSIAAGASFTSATLDCSVFAGIDIGMEAVFGTVATTAGAKCEVLGSPDNVSFDTIARLAFTIPAIASTTSQQSLPADPEIKYFKMKVTNLDATNAISVWGYSVGMTI